MRIDSSRLKLAGTSVLTFVGAGGAQQASLLHNAAWPSGSDCVDHAWESDAVYTYRCHGETNQQWELTTDGQLRSVWGKCLEYFDDQDTVAAVACDEYRRQKWYVTNGLIKPQGFRLPSGAWSMRVGFCLDSAQPDGHLILYGCHGDKSQQFSGSFLPTLAEDVVHVDGAWATNQNCLDYDYSANVAYVYACHGQWNQRWHFTSDDEFRVGDTKCLEYDSKDQVVVRDCSKAENQKWVVLDDGHVQPKAVPTKCLDVAYSTSKLALAACVADKPNQKFRSTVLKPKNRDLLKVRGPWAEPQTCVDYAWGTDVAYVYSCHGQANQLWEFTNDEQIRTTENKCLEFDGDGLLRVAVKPCDSQRATQKWRPKASGEIVPRGYFDSKNAWRVPGKCLDVALEDQKLQLWDCVESALNQKFRSNAMPTRNRDLVFADGASPASPGANCVRAVDTFVVVAKCGATREMLWEFKADNTLMVDVDGGLCLTAVVGGVSGKLELAKCTGGASQRWDRTASGTIALQAGAAGWGKCLDWTSQPTVTLVACGTTTSTMATQKFSSTIFTSVASGALNTLYEKTNILSETVKTDAFLTPKVLSSASDVVTEAARVLASSDKSDVARATEFLQQFISKNENVTDLRVRSEALYTTSGSEEFLLSLSILLQSADGDPAASVIQVIAPAIKTFSEQLYEARYDALLDHVLRGDVNRLEAYTDGTLSDFNEVGGVLSAVCGMITTSPAASQVAASMCRLAPFFTLIDQFFQLKYKLLAEGARGLSETSRSLARTVVQTFQTNRALLEDPLWRRLMTLLVLGGPYVDVLPVTTLSRASRGEAYLPTFVLYDALGNDKFMEELTPMVRFVSDQITTFHVNNVLNLTSSKDIDGLEAYMAEPINTYSVLTDTSSTSDFAMVALYVVPLVCGDPARQALSLCQLEQVYTGLQAVLSFEHARRSSVVSLEDVLEVDVRKKLDVIDQEKKQFEMISTLQDVANKIGTTILSGMADLKTQIATSTAAIRSDIEAARKDLRDAIGSVGQQLQTSIEQSTELLYKEVGQQAASIRQDIADSSQRLEQRLDDTGRAILGSIEQSKQELKYQIGAEAERTREFISDKTNELKDHMSKETQGLREFVDVKTNQVIGVVREEGASTREVVNQATNQIVRTVQQEGAITRAFVDTKTNEIKEVVKVESAKTREFVDMKTNQVIGVVREESQATRAFVDKKGDQVIGVVKEEGEKTRQEVRSEGAKIREHIDVKTEEVKKVVHEEGAATRTDLNKKVNDLKKYINTTSEDVKTQVQKSQKAVTDLSKKQFDTLNGNIDAATEAVESSVSGFAKSEELNALAAAATKEDCKDDMWAPNSKFRLAFVAYQNATGVVREYRRKPALNDANIGWAETLGYLRLKPLEKVASVFMYVRSLYYLLNFDLDEATGSGWMNLDGRPNAFPQEYSQLTSLIRKLQNGQNYDLVRDYTKVLKGEKVEIVTSRWEELRVAINLPSRSVWESVSKQIHDACKSLGSASQFYEGCVSTFESENTYSDVYNKLATAIEALETMRATYRESATRKYKCNVATSGLSTKVRRTRLRHLSALASVATKPNEPFYAMTYSALTKVLLDYRLQEAADQFCKYYAFRDGGVAPPMCGDTQGTSRPYYSLSKIQEMRSWQPPAYPRITSRIMLPTQPLVQVGTGREYPYVDLQTLATGGTVTFDVPTWDLDWLKRYLWVPLNAKPETLASYYVESMRLYLPIEPTTGTSSPSTPLAVTVVAESAVQQFVNWRASGHTYQLPAQRFQFDAAYNMPVCASTSRATNPYHEAAECVATADRSSQLCLTQETPPDSSSRLLPSLFSGWRFRADLDASNSQFRVVQPLVPATNATSAPVELNLFADVTLVRVAASTRGVAASEGGTTAVAATNSCCARDEYRSLQSGVCTKCPEAAVPALNGYTCTSA